MPELISLPFQPVLSVRRTIPVAQLGPTQGQGFKLLHAQCQEQGLTLSGAPFVRYHRFDQQETDVEIGIPITSPGDNAGEVKANTRPGGPALRLWHLGPHDTLGESYRALNNWLSEHGREASGPAWEVYEWLDLDPDAVRPDPSEWRTQLVQPLKGEPV